MKLRWRCGRCGAHGLTRIESRQVWHDCRPPRRPRRAVQLPTPAVDIESMRADLWSNGWMGDDPDDPLRKESA